MNNNGNGIDKKLEYAFVLLSNYEINKRMKMYIFYTASVKYFDSYFYCKSNEINIIRTFSEV